MVTGNPPFSCTPQPLRLPVNASSENAINVQLVTVPLQKVRKRLCLHGEVGDVQKTRKKRPLACPFQKFSEREGVRLFGVCAVKQRNTVFSKLFLKYHQS